MTEMCNCRRLYEAGLVPEWIRQEIQRPREPMRLPWWISGEPEPEAETWKSTLCGYYEVSTLGNVRRAKPGHATFVGRPVRHGQSATGYAQIQLSGDTKRRVYVHRLVAEVFLGPCPPGYVVNHKNTDKLDNRLSNLEYVTRLENVHHALRNVTRHKGPTKPKEPPKGLPTGERHWTKTKPERMARGDRMPHSKLTTEIVRDIRRRCAAGERQKVLAAEYGISVAQCSRVVRGKRWTYVEEDK